MRVVKILVVLFVAMVVAVPVGIVGLLALVANIGQSANSQYDELADVQTVAHDSSAPQPAVANNIKTQQLQAGNVTLYFSPAMAEQHAADALTVLNSKCLLGTGQIPYGFELSETSAGMACKLLDQPPRAFCEEMQPTFSSMATILSHTCFAGQPVRFVMVPDDADGAVIAESRKDVAACWFDGSQSIFFDQAYSATQQESILEGFRDLGMIGEGSDLVHQFYRNTPEGGQIDVIGDKRSLAQIPSAVLLATLRHRALNCSLRLFECQATEYCVTDTGFQRIASFVHTPPFQPTRVAQNGCMMFLADESIAQETLDAIAARATNIPGREITIDFWLRKTNDGYTALVPCSDSLLADADEVENALCTTGRCVNSELPPDAQLTMIGCDYGFQAKQSVHVTDRAGPYLARNNNRLDYWQPFDEAFANRVADYLEAQGMFTEDGAAHVEIYGSQAPESLPYIQLYVNPRNFTADMAGQVKAFSKQMAAELFPEQLSVFQLCDPRGQPLEDFVWQHEAVR